MDKRQVLLLKMITGFVLTISFSCLTTKDEPYKSELNTMDETSNEKTVNDSISVEYVMGKFEPSIHPSFVKIPLQYADREGLYMRKEAYDAFVEMYQAALKEGIKLQIRSATRNFEYQKGIWERKWKGETLLSDGTNVAKDIHDSIQKSLKILEYSSMPGTSRHHWGTDVDFNSFNNTWFSKGEGLKLYNWMLEHAHAYGYCQPYTAISDERSHGYFEEKWHWSYTPLSSELTRFAKENITENMITGFDGANTAETIGVVEKYIMGINKNCL